MQGQLLDDFKDPLRAPKRIEANENRPNPSVEDRIAALEAKIEALHSEVEAQNAIIKQLQERRDQRQQKKK
jgi:TolA-binding protein